MNIRATLLILILGFSGETVLFAQEGGVGIKVTSVLHSDGSRTDTQTDIEAASSEEKTYDAGGKLTRRVVYKLDGQGQPAEGTVFSPTGTVLYYFTYTRDTRGRISEERDMTPKGELFQRFVYHYGSNGRVSGIDAFDAQGQLIKPGSSGTPSKKPSRPRR